MHKDIRIRGKNPKLSHRDDGGGKNKGAAAAALRDTAPYEAYAYIAGGPEPSFPTRDHTVQNLSSPPATL